MAEFLFRGKNNGTDPANWRAGDLVTIQPDGWGWGRFETKSAWVASGADPAAWPADFYLLKVPGLSVARVYLWLIRRFNDDDGTLGRRSLWRAVFANFPAGVRSTLLATGELTVGVNVTRAQLQAAIVRKDTGATLNLDTTVTTVGLEGFLVS